MARQIGCGDIICENLYAQATIKCEEGNYEAAEGMYRESILVARSFNDCLGLARSLRGLSKALEQRGNTPESVTALEESCSLYREISFRGIERVQAAQELARSKEAEGDMEATFFWLADAVDQSRKLERREFRPHLWNMEETGKTMLKQQRYSEAPLSFEALSVLNREIGLVKSARRMTSLLASIPKTAM